MKKRIQSDIMTYKEKKDRLLFFVDFVEYYKQNEIGWEFVRTEEEAETFCIDIATYSNIFTDFLMNLKVEYLNTFEGLFPQYSILNGKNGDSERISILHLEGLYFTKKEMNELIYNDSLFRFENLPDNLNIVSVF